MFIQTAAFAFLLLKNGQFFSCFSSKSLLFSKKLKLESMLGTAVGNETLRRLSLSISFSW
jgi:hypothetical protein